MISRLSFISSVFDKSSSIKTTNINQILTHFQMSDLLQIRRLTRNAFLPAKATKDAAGYDLYSPYNYIVPARGKALILSDLQVKESAKCLYIFFNSVFLKGYTTYRYLWQDCASFRIGSASAYCYRGWLVFQPAAGCQHEL